MNTFLINIKDLAFIIILISSILYLRSLKLKKWKSSLSIGETTIYILTGIAIPIYGIIYFMLLLGT
ncbi:hypothetical protein [Lysinibacillus capsici]|uniref:hypothetical protein n=1 Tax=Lysinibacillus capsici TaxID=2115968 RepID=UPI0020A0AF68|nr:hypothetical protein [Lysinibacillus capsici]